MEQNIFLQEYFKIMQYLYQLKKYIKYFSGTTRISSWKSNEISEENIESITKSYSNFVSTFVGLHLSRDISFNGKYLKNNISIPKKVINPYISYTLTPQFRNLNTDFTLINCLFGCVKLTKNADPDKYKYNVYDIGFDFRSECLFVDESMGRKSSSVDIDNKGKDILIYGEGPIQGLDYTTLTVETKYPINFTRLNKKFVSNLH